MAATGHSDHDRKRTGGRVADTIFRIENGSGPLVATAIHDGHDVRPEVLDLMKISEADRLREEDPYTADWTAMAPTRVVGTRSRFELDLNRPRESAVYRTPADAWGLEVWKNGIPEAVVARSLEEYDGFYSRARATLLGHGRSFRPFRGLRPPHLQPPPRRRRRSGGGPGAQSSGQCRDRDAARSRPLGAGGRSLHRRPGGVRFPRREVGRARERQVPRRQLRPMGPRHLSGLGLRTLHRGQEVLHG